MVTAPVLVFAGGGLGAITREVLVLLFGRYSAAFPVDIFSANMIAAYLLGLVFGLHQARRTSDTVALLISTGFCGGMSTFSTFAFGAYSEMATPGELALSLLYVIASVVVGYSVTLLGLQTAAQFRRA